ncbi:hypothetical protein KSE_58480 [Kitasatospora setae KM-6054]|uniref:Uncharacterized protein n=1 Tax=Kitasatospora setae (strain ATCC 33774 / DSM 43861 / JCM 3304 / KCC A-0304 / NBRC 14216 / KM-6054) TaxID=452652 RepID=E4N3Y7_KITSK|nr:hypothetical protein KSE_58480 [Kitasatospora setae KM-6054]
MKLTRLAGECEKGTCPTVYGVDGTGDLIVQGYVVDSPEALEAIQVPPGEAAVRIPASLIRRLANAHLG